MKNCTEKIAYQTQAEAEAEVRSMRKDLRKVGGGHGLRRLNAYRCDQHQCWHVGRSSRYGVKLQKPAERRIPTTGQLWRRLRKIDERLDKERQHRAFTLGQLLERDRQRYEAEGLL